MNRTHVHKYLFNHGSPLRALCSRLLVLTHYLRYHCGPKCGVKTRTAYWHQPYVDRSQLLCVGTFIAIQQNDVSYDARAASTSASVETY